MNDSYHREEELFAAALARPTAERAGFLREACAGDADLRTRVEDLLRHAAGGGDFLDTPPERELAEAARAAREALPGDEPPGTRIGRYTLREKVGEGGCGVVYRAEQTGPVRREVALKIIKLGMDTREVIARFAAERQALALMDHPHIARVFDAGATESGRPFFAMELVPGTKITEWCDEHRLGLEERLRLFVQVCAAVQHAHQKGIIHRDLKPSNILVSSQDGAPVPKVIDFGIAKATQGKLTEHTLVTAVEQLIGTPAYMSPEQVERGGADVDTRSDIYSLGVLLYELLTGCTPVDPAELRQASVDEIRRRIREQESPRPSVRLRALDRETRTIAASRRRLEPDQLVRRLNGDLDWIALRCLEKERGRRYETVNGLAHDLERFLQHEPVHARPPGRVYLFAKFIRRHRFGVAAGAAVVLALLAGLVVSTTLYFRVTAAVQQAGTNERKAQREAIRSAEVARFMQDMLKGVAPAVAQGRDTTLLRQILDATAPRLDALQSQPEVQADLRVTVGRIYYEIGEMAQASDLLAVAVDQNRRLHGDLHLKTAEALHCYGLALRGQMLVDEAVNRQREAVAILRRLKGDRNVALLAPLNALGLALVRLARLPEAEMAFQQELAIAQVLHGEANADGAIEAFLGLGQVREAERKYPEAEAIYRRVLSDYWPEGIGPARLALKNAALFHLGTTLWSRARREPRFAVEAEAVLRETVAFERKYFGELNPQTPQTLNVLSSLLADHGRRNEAIAVSREQIALLRRRLPLEPGSQAISIRLATGLKNLGVLLAARGDLTEAENCLEESASLLRGRPRALIMAGLLQTLGIHGEILLRLNKLSAAESVFREGMELVELAPDWNVTRIAAGLHQALGQQGRPDDVEEMWVRCMERSRRLTPEETAGDYTIGLINAMVLVGRHTQAEAFAREHLDFWEKRAPDDWQVFALRTLIGNALVERKSFAEAEPLLLSGCVGLRERIDHVSTQVGVRLIYPYQNLERLYTAWGKPEQATEWRQKHQAIAPAAGR